MAEATLTQLRNTHPALTTVPDDVLNQHLADAKSYIEAHGYTSAHARFNELQRYKACHLLSVADQGKSNIKSKSIADVSISYGGVDTYTNFISTDWEREFYKIKLQIEGLADRCL
jgi:hypothetical protein